MSKFQVFLIVLYLFFFGGVGGWVLELLFRRFFSGANPERKWLNPGFLFGPCLPLYGFGTVLLFILSELDHTLFGSFSGTFWYYPVMFVVMALAMTLLEYIVGLVSLRASICASGTTASSGAISRALSARCSRSSGAFCRWGITSCSIRDSGSWSSGSWRTRWPHSWSACASAFS